MVEAQGLKIFISWSGDLSRVVAAELREWIPMLFDTVQPFMSEADIGAGSRGLAQIEAELAGSCFGIIIVTPSNQGAPWLNFEAGALSKVVGPSVEARVVPLLVDISSPTQIQGPLAQFQAKPFDANGIRDLVRAIATVAGVKPEVADSRCQTYWPKLDEAVNSAKSTVTAETQPPRGTNDVLEEVLAHVRALRRERDHNEEADLVSYVVWGIARDMGVELAGFSLDRRLNGQRYISALVPPGLPAARIAELRERLSATLNATVLVRDQDPEDAH